jgi:hypothetical protein
MIGADSFGSTAIFSSSSIAKFGVLVDASPIDKTSSTFSFISSLVELEVLGLCDFLAAFAGLVSGVEGGEEGGGLFLAVLERVFRLGGARM